MTLLGAEERILRACHGALYPWSYYLTETVSVVPPLVIAWAYLHRRRASYTLLAALAVSDATTALLKLITGEPRPFVLHVVGPLAPVDDPYGSLPSGHASRSFALAAAYHLQRRGPLSPILWAWAALVGATRVILGVHWPHDVVAGALVGIGAALLAHRTSRLWTRLLTTLDPLARRTARTA